MVGRGDDLALLRQKVKVKMAMKPSWLLTMLVALASFEVGIAAENAQPKANDAAVEAPKPLPRKKAEYAKWSDASQVAEALKQPIVVFVEMGGDKTSSDVKSAIFGKQSFFKDLYAENFVYLHLTVPQVKDKSKNRNNNVRDRRQKTGKPNWDRVSDKNCAQLKSLFSSSGQRMPVVALVDAQGKVLDASMIGDAETPLKSFVDALSSGMKAGKFADFKLGKKVEKAIAEEKKRAEFAAKIAEAQLKAAK